LENSLTIILLACANPSRNIILRKGESILMGKGNIIRYRSRLFI
jgi:hypothetical protein